MRNLGTIDGGGTLRIDPQRLVDTRLMVQGTSGCGKSYLIRKLCETVAADMPVVVLDCEGEFVTLREKLDVVIAGEAGDVAVDVRSAGMLARKVLELRVSAVVDLFDLTWGDRRAYVRAFLESMMAAPRELWGSRLIVLDEAHQFAPETAKAESLSAATDVASRGRKRGFCLAAATQRLSKLHKDVTAEARNLLVGQTTQDIDVKRSLDVLGMPADLEHKSAIRQLDHQFYAFGPAFAHDGVELVRAGKPATTHPEGGARRDLAAPAPSRRIKSVLGELADLPEKAKAEAKTLAEAKAEITRLRRENTRLAKSGEVDQQAIENAVAKAIAERDKFWGGEVAKIERSRGVLAGRITKIGELAILNGEASVAVSKPPPSPRVVPAPSRAPAVSAPKPVIAEGDFRPNKAQQRVLDALAWWEGLGVRPAATAQVGAVALIAAPSGHFQNTVGPLSRHGLIERTQGEFSLTPAGAAIAEPPEQVATLAEYHDVLRRRVQSSKRGSGATVRILDALLAGGGQAMSIEEIGERAGIVTPSGHFRNSIGPLSTMGFIKRNRGVVTPSEMLFPGGLS